jgi:hypothetical protein
VTDWLIDKPALVRFEDSPHDASSGAGLLAVTAAGQFRVSSGGALCDA